MTVRWIVSVRLTATASNFNQTRDAHPINYSLTYMSKVLSGIDSSLWMKHLRTRLAVVDALAAACVVCVSSEYWPVVNNYNYNYACILNIIEHR